MNANAVEPRFPSDLPHRILSTGSPRMWMPHYLRMVGTKEDLDQIAWEVCLDPKHAGRVERMEVMSLGGFVAAKMRSEVLKSKRSIRFSDNRAGKVTARDEDSLEPPHQEDDTVDPFEEYIDPKDRELVRDRFYAGNDRAEQELLLVKYGLKTTAALRMRALRAVNAARRKHNDSDKGVR